MRWKSERVKKKKRDSTTEFSTSNIQFHNKRSKHLKILLNPLHPVCIITTPAEAHPHITVAEEKVVEEEAHRNGS
ncbi:hypothetical protein E2C01_087057 [Portunus trituberculatus]|uniref:Uncharacterized protein n=1 Tax=Portunus trituberculatus TaxID=210409 RepID=A0A5B7JAZ5_PORTR|nr:hypothetical protein [Portunus trituberculatus]